MIRALIVDDEPLARERVALLLGEHADFLVVGEAGHGVQAIKCIRSLRPDVVFLDVQMPSMSGFDVVEAIGPEAMPHTVFVTAYDAYAIRAFEAEALDYVLKPFDDLRFGRVLDRVRRARNGEGLPGAATRARPTQHLVARMGGRMRIVPWDEIDWIAAAGAYVEVHAGAQVLLVDDTISGLASRLPAALFARAHRSLIVRLDRIVEVKLDPHGDGTMLLTTGDELRISRRYRVAIDRHLGRI